MTKTAQQLVAAGEVLDNVERLRQILDKQQHRKVTYEEAAEVGNSLISFYEILGGAIA